MYFNYAQSITIISFENENTFQWIQSLAMLRHISWELSASQIPEMTIFFFFMGCFEWAIIVISRSMSNTTCWITHFYSLAWRQHTLTQYHVTILNKKQFSKGLLFYCNWVHSLTNKTQVVKWKYKCLQSWIINYLLYY